jgi:hypothetical protein
MTVDESCLQQLVAGIEESRGRLTGQPDMAQSLPRKPYHSRRFALPKLCL